MKRMVMVPFISLVYRPRFKKDSLSVTVFIVGTIYTLFTLLMIAQNSRPFIWVCGELVRHPRQGH